MNGTPKSVTDQIPSAGSSVWQKAAALLGRIQWYRIVLVLLILVAPYLALHNLETNPRPWQDEGAYLSVAKSLAEGGMYAVKTSDGYQTFGPVQSVGPTVIVPVALVFKLFGAGLLQARIMIVVLSFVMAVLFYFAAKALFGPESATLAVLLLLGAPAVEFLLISRQVIGENVALGFMLGGFLLLRQGLKSQKYVHFALTGVLFGAAMVTKAQFAMMIFGSLFLLLILDLFYYKLGTFRQLVVIGFFALACVVGWWAWQYFYFGPELFRENSDKLVQLYQSAGGVYLGNVKEAIRFFAGTGSGHFYLFLGIPALVYMGLLCLRRSNEGYSLAFLLLFCLLWIVYYMFWINPWWMTAYAPMVITAIFVGKLWSDLIQGFVNSAQKFGPGAFKRFVAQESIQEFLMPMGTLLLIIALAGFTLYNIQRAVRAYVMDQYGIERMVIKTPLELQAPQQVAEYLSAIVNDTETVETWERELGILTDLTYHYPDQSLLGDTYGAIYRNQPRSHILGEEYLQETNASYLVIGWFARSTFLYDMEYVESHSQLIATFGYSDWRYDVYELELTD